MCGWGVGGFSFSCEAKDVWWRLAPLRCSIDFPTPGQTLLSLCDNGCYGDSVILSCGVMDRHPMFDFQLSGSLLVISVIQYSLRLKMANELCKV